MKRFGHWIDRQIHERPFFSALIVLIMVIVPRYARLESAVNTANEAAESASAAADSAADTAKELVRLASIQNASEKATQLANCQTRNGATKNNRDRFDTFFTALETLFTSNPNQTPEQRAQATKFVEDLRAGVPLDPKSEDVDCNGDGQLDKQDYATK